MIYFTTFIFTLLLAHIARALPACSDVASPEDMFDPTYDTEQLILRTYNVTSDPKYDNPSGPFACSKRLSFPYIGAAFDIKRHGSPNCGKCWRLSDVNSDKFIYFTAIDSAKSGFILSNLAYNKLNGGNGTLIVNAVQAPAHICAFN